jgi:hypothetical protein
LSKRLSKFLKLQ